MFSTDADHLPLPPSRRTELDRLFHGEPWEPDAPPHQGYEREPLSTSPFQVRMQAHIHKHRSQAENVGWDVAAVLSSNRDGFGSKGPLEVSSERMIQHSFIGELQAVSQILRTGSVHPDVADSRGQTASIAATVNCHDDVIHSLLDVGADIDKSNSEGMSASAVSHILCYSFQSSHTALIDPPIKTPVSRTRVNQADSTSRTPVLSSEPQATGKNMMDQNSLNQLSDPATEEPPVQFCRLPAESEQLHKEKRKETGEDEGFEDTEDAGDEQSDREDEESKSGKSKDEIHKDVPDLTEETNRDVDEMWDGHVSPGTVQWKQVKNKDSTQKQALDSTPSVRNYNFGVKEESSAEASSQSGKPQQHDSRETAHKMAGIGIEHGARLHTSKSLSDRGADPNLSKVPMPVLFLAIMAGDTEVVRKSLSCGARTDIPLPTEKKGFYPSHVAAALPGPEGPEITESLSHAITDPDARACDQDDIYEPDSIFMKDKKSSDGKRNSHSKEGGRTALHIACQRNNDYLNASKVVALSLSHRASTDLLWSGHSPLSLAIASGNDWAVDELLKGGADPNLALGCRVGSALCALANFSYHFGGNRIKSLDKLAKAGADILMPVRVGEVVGTAVDFAHYSFQQDLRIAHTPFHALNTREREIFKARRHSSNVMSDLLRQTAGKEERRNVEREQHLSSNTSEDGSLSRPTSFSEGKSNSAKSHRQLALKFCYHCGRSSFVKSIACGRCLRVFFCSKACKSKAWDERHKEECLQASASADVIQKSIAFKTQRDPRPPTVMKSRPVPQPSSVAVESLRVPQPFVTAEKMSENQVNSRENYSFN